MRNVSDKICTENQNTHFMFNNFFPENCTVSEIMWKNMAQTDSPQMAILYGAEKTQDASVQTRTL